MKLRELLQKGKIKEGGTPTPEDDTKDPKVYVVKGPKGDKGDQGPEGPAPSVKALAELMYKTVTENKHLFVGPIGPQGPEGPMLSEDKAKEMIASTVGNFFVQNQDLFKGEKGADADVNSPEVQRLVKAMTQKQVEEQLTESEKKLLKILRAEMAKIAQSMDRIGGGGSAPQSLYADDLSSQCDGSNKTFATDYKFYGAKTLSLMGTDFPIVYRKDVDFTYNGNTQQIVLTDEVPAPSSGATLVARYEIKRR